MKISVDDWKKFSNDHGLTSEEFKKEVLEMAVVSNMLWLDMDSGNTVEFTIPRKDETRTYKLTIK